MVYRWACEELKNKPYCKSFYSTSKEMIRGFDKLRSQLKQDPRVVAYNISITCEPHNPLQGGVTCQSRNAIQGYVMIADKTILNMIDITDGAFDVLELLDYKI
jgi:hypothetical protein